MIARKLLILLIIFLSIAGCSEPGDPIDKAGGTTLNVDLQIVLHDSYDDLLAAYPHDDMIQLDYDEYLEGFSLFMRNVPARRSVCEVHIIEPQEIDGEHTLTLGHEVLHCVYGLYHE